MPMASSWKLSTTLRRKKSLGSMLSPAFARAGPPPSRGQAPRLREGRPPAFARAGPPPSRGQALEPVNRLAVALAVGVVHRREQVGRPGHLELHDGQGEAGMTPEDTGEDQIAHRQRRIERLVARLLASRKVLSPAPRILPCRR